MSPIVRIATHDDARSIAALGLCVWIDTYAFEGVTDDFASHVFAQFSQAQIEASTASESVVIAEVSGKLVGYAVLIRRDGEIEIDNFYVLPKLQGRGIGKQIVSYISGTCSRVWLACWDQNTSAIQFYKSLGFTECGESQFDLKGAKYRNVHLCRSTQQAIKPVNTWPVFQAALHKNCRPVQG